MGFQRFCHVQWLLRMNYSADCTDLREKKKYKDDQENNKVIVLNLYIQ